MFTREHLLFIAASLIWIASIGLCRAQVPPHREAEKAWQTAMSQVPLPKKGCFKASYPKMEWQEVPCSKRAPRTVGPQRQRSGQGGDEPPILDTVGSASGDFAATTGSLIKTVVGSFISVTPGTTESGSGGSDNFSLQINSQFLYSTSACKGHSGCYAWQQFVFNNNPAADVDIQYWLLNYGPGCPSYFVSTNGTDCLLESRLDVFQVTTADLASLTLTATAAGSMDTVVLAPQTGLVAVGEDSILNLEQYWNYAEFNVFGAGNFSQASFSAGTTIVVKTTIDDGTTNAPSCPSTLSTTGETNNLNLVTCCPYGGASPNIQFMETNAGHKAVCGATALLGDPHITTADGTRYDLQGAGEFVSLRDSDGAEIQTRQTPASTMVTGTDSYDELTTCVSLNTAVAARVGKHRVTYEPDLSGEPDPSGLQLRIDGVLTALGPQGMDLGNGGRVYQPSPPGSLAVKSSLGGALAIDFPDGKTLFVTPQWWASQSKWFLNVNVVNLGLQSGEGRTSLGGIGAPIATRSWLPALPNGASLGPMPASLHDRYVTLYQTFADAWRVTNKDSLFDYAAGTSTQTFTDKNWPPDHPPCVVPDVRPVEPASEEFAQAACRRVFDKNMHSDCVFDVRITGNADFASTYLETQRVLTDSTTISLTGDADPSQPGEWVTFTAYVASNSSNSTRTGGYPSGTVQFAVDGSNVEEPVPVDARGRAKWETSQLKVGTHRVMASYLPGADTSFLPSTSLERLHIVRRCPCDKERERK